MKIDLVCGMEMSESDAKYHLSQNGETYYFCSAYCKDAFASQASIYTKPPKKRIFKKFLERLAKENSRTYGNNKPSCH